MPPLSRGCRCDPDYVRSVIGRFPEEEREAMKGDDKAQIEAKSKALEEAAQALFAAAAAAAQPGAEGGDQGDAGNSPRNDDVVDAEFTEVKDEDKK